MINKKNIMDCLLGTDDNAFNSSAKELDCLIYRNGINEVECMLSKPASKPSSMDNILLEIWEGKVKIRIKVGGDDATHVSMRKLTSIAVEAIMAELQKEKDQ